MTKRQSVGYGLTNPGPVSNGIPSGDALEAELVKAIQQRRKIQMAQQLGLLAPEPNGHVHTPQPETLSEMTKTILDTAKTAVEIKDSVARTALDERKLAEERADRAEQNVDKKTTQAVEAVKAEAANTLEIFKTFATITQENIKMAYESKIEGQNSAHDAEIKVYQKLDEIKDKIHEAKLEAINTKVDAMGEKFSILLDQKDRKIAELEEERDAAYKRPTLDNVLLRAIKGEATPEFEVIKKLVAPNTPISDDPDTQYRAIVAKGFAEADVQARNNEVAAQQREAQRKDEIHEVVKGIGQGAAELLKGAREAIPHLFTPSTGIDKNGVPPDFPPNGQPPDPGMQDGGFGGYEGGEQFGFGPEVN